MRYATLRSKTIDAGLHPDECSLAAAPDVSRGRMHQFTQLDDGTILLLYELRGDLERAAEILSASSNVLQCEIAGEETGFAYVHTKPVDPATSILSLLRTNEVLPEFPIEYTSTGHLRVTLVAERESLHAVVSSIADFLPVELERMGEHAPDVEYIASRLTDRQQEVLTLATERGYFELPRRVGLDTLADELEISTATVSEHLQKIERTILPQFAL